MTRVAAEILMPSSTKSKIIAISISAALLFFSFRYIYFCFQWRDIYRILRQVDVFLLLFWGGASIFAYWFLRALRWFLILRRLNVYVKFGSLYLCTAISLSLAILTPMQSGEALKVELLKKMGALDRSPAYSSFALERYLDLCTVVLLAIFSFAARLISAGNRWYLLYLLIILFALVAGLIGICKWELKGRLGEVQQHIRECVNSPATILQVSLLTLACWMAVAAGWQACLRSLSMNIGFQPVLAVMSIMTIINILSFIPGAVGISEAGIAELLMRFGQTIAIAQAGALILRFYGIMIILFGSVHLMIWYAVLFVMRRAALRSERL